jgi:2'-hydroxyisoflavone reductase
VRADRDDPDAMSAGQAPVLAPAPPDIDDPAADGYAAYGHCKVACEQAVLAAFEDSAFVCRAGLIVGPEDDSGRFEYWVRRLAAGGEVLAPVLPTIRSSSSTYATWPAGSPAPRSRA